MTAERASLDISKVRVPRRRNVSGMRRAAPRRAAQSARQSARAAQLHTAHIAILESTLTSTFLLPSAPNYTQQMQPLHDRLLIKPYEEEPVSCH